MKYHVELSIAFPSPMVPDDFATVKDDLEKAVNDFNIKFRGKKQIRIMHLGQNIKVELDTFSAVSNPTREVSAFSQILKSTYGWHQYSQNDNRLFDAKVVLTIGTRIPIQNTTSSTDDPNTFMRNMMNLILIEESIDSIDNYIREFSHLLEVSKARKIIIEAQKII